MPSAPSARTHPLPACWPAPSSASCAPSLTTAGRLPGREGQTMPPEPIRVRTLPLHDLPAEEVAEVYKPAPLLVTASVAAQMLAISPRTLWSLTAAGKIPVVRLGRAVRYDRRDLLAFIDAAKK